MMHLIKSGRRSTDFWAKMKEERRSNWKGGKKVSLEHMKGKNGNDQDIKGKRDQKSLIIFARDFVNLKRSRRRAELMGFPDVQEDISYHFFPVCV